MQAFTKKAELQKHMETHKDSSQRQMFHCHICAKKFKQKSTLGAHLRWHQNLRLHKCHTCQKGFPSKQRLREHQETHLGANRKRFPCPRCSNSYVSYTGLLFHLASHDNDRKYKCSQCDQRFYQREVSCRNCVNGFLKQLKLQCNI